MTDAGPRPATILVLADDELRAARIESTLRSDGRWCVKVGRLVDFRARIAAHRPDAIVLAGPVERAAHLLEATAAASPLVVLLAPAGGPEEWTSKKRAANLRAVLRDDVSDEEIQAALAAVLAGLVVRHPEMATSATPTQASSGGSRALTGRELEILEMMAEGIDNRRIALRLRISRNTVKFHVASILDKLHASSRTEAVTIAIRTGRISV